jgi:hypothetical protein
MKNFILYFVVLSVIIVSCDQEDPNIQSTNAKALAGEWFVTYSIGGSDVGGGYSTIITSNTAANLATEILISDYVDPNAKTGNFWSYKVKAQADPDAKSFTASESVSTALINNEDPYPIKVNILNGKIIPFGGKSRTGVVVDSIYFEIQFEDDATPFENTFIVSGHKRTGFTADEY